MKTNIWVVTIVPVTVPGRKDEKVRVIPVATDDRDDPIEACERAARFLPFVSVWTASAEQQSAYDCVENADLLLDLLQAAYDDLCESSDGNDYVSDEQYDAGIEEYHCSYEQLWEACNV